MKNNYKFLISYDGTRYFGWEHQPGKETIQGKIETVLMRMTDSVTVPEVLAAGRTDAGVHAKGMVASCVLETELSPEEIKDYCNKYLPEDICINDVKVASDRFHARYNAIGKTYRYTCYAGKEKPVFDRKYVYTLDEVPDVERMKKAAALLEGEHDFKSFCGNPKMKKSTVRLVDKIEVEYKRNYLTITCHGTGFLQHMVRNIVGTLLEVGFKRMEPEYMTELLEARDRRLAGPTAPAAGLCLLKVDYM